jgi:uncharacterized Zn-binding protein involved in type VI secretion
MSLDNLILAAQQKADGTTGDTTGGPVGINHAAATGDVLKQVAEGQIDGFKALGEPLSVPGPDGKPRAPEGKFETSVAVARRAQQVIGAVTGAVGAVENALDMGFAALTAPLAAMFPSLPSAPMGSIYIGVPHTHAHPPSLIPPAPPVPLPSFGPIMLGNSVQVLIQGMPAGRAGDKGIAPTCCGFTPFFDIVLGSSNVFIGGKRAARIGDMCQACVPGGGAMGAVAKVMQAAGMAAGALGIAADIGEAVILADSAEANASLAAAKALNAAMTAAQMAADAAAMAAVVADPATSPSKGAIAVPLGVTVLIGGFPMMNTMEFAKAVLNKLRALGRKKPASDASNSQAGPCGCPKK